MRKLRCFVASAFGHDDVDTVYGQICRVLRELNVQAVRVDKVNHNDDIDDKIFELLDSSDLCIAALTYARPSVYYEAGYSAGRGRPVIYVVREDHFDRRKDDAFGNLRVHFDLQMKNIIPWGNGGSAFRRELKRRAQLVLRPVRSLSRADALLSEQRTAFQMLSQAQQLGCLATESLKILKTFGLRSQLKRVRKGTPPRPRAIAYRVHDDALQQVIVRAQPSLLKTQLREAHKLPSLLVRDPDEDLKFRRRQQYVVYCSLRKTPRAMISDVLSNCVPYRDVAYRHTESNRNVGDLTYAFIGGIQSLGEFRVQFRSMIERLLV